MDFDSFQQLRSEYSDLPLNFEDLDPDPFIQFQIWFDQAKASGVYEPNAMILATCNSAGAPSVRAVLLKGLDHRGFCFFSNYKSKKAQDIKENPQASLLFYWPELHRQVRFQGQISKMSNQESDQYFQLRPIEAQLGARASAQSQPLADRQQLEKEIEQQRLEFSETEVPRPEYWGGYRLAPTSCEFWQGRRSRLHDRLLYTPEGDKWGIGRLYP